MVPAVPDLSPGSNAPGAVGKLRVESALNAGLP